MKEYPLRYYDNGDKSGCWATGIAYHSGDYYDEILGFFISRCKDTLVQEGSDSSWWGPEPEIWEPCPVEEIWVIPKLIYPRRDKNGLSRKLL